MKLHWGMGWLAALAVSVLPLHAETTAPAVPDEATLGAQALAAQDYPAAWDYFVRFRDQAPPGSELRLKAYDGLFAAAPALRDAAKLEPILADYDKEFPNRNDLKRRFMAGELAFQKGDLKGAQAVFDALPGNEPAGGEIYYLLLSEKGRLKIALADYAGAAEIYSLLAKSAANTAWEMEALLLQIYATMKAGNLTASADLIAQTKARQELSEQVQRELHLMQLLQMGFERQYSELDQAYAKLAPTQIGEADLMRCEVATIAAENHQKNKRFAQALPYWTDAFNVAPDEQWRQNAARQIINTRMGAEDLEGALESLRKYLTMYPNLPGDDEMRLLEPRLLVRLKRPEEAMKDYQALIDDTRFQAAQWRLAAKELALLYRTNKREAESLTVLTALLNRSAVGVERQESVFLLGEYYFAIGKWAEAAKEFLSITHENGPYKSRSLYWGMRSLAEQKEWADALNVADLLIKNADSTPGMRAAAFYYRGLMLEKLERFGEAILAFNNGADRFPQSPYALASRFHAAELAWAMNDYVHAAAWFAQVAEQTRTPEITMAGDAPLSQTDLQELAANALYRATESAGFADRPADMSSYLEELKKTAPKSVYTLAALFWQIDYLKNQQDYDLALANLQEMADFYAELMPERLPAIWYDQAELNGRLNRVVDALNALDLLTQQYPQDPLAADAWYLTGDLLTRDGKFDAAREAYKKALTSRPEGEFALAVRGRLGDCSFELYGLHQRDEDLKLAETYYRGILANPAVSAAMKAQTLYKLGRTLEAAKTYNEAIQCYRDLVYGARAAAQNGQIPGEAWVAKGGYAAIKLCLAQNNPDAARQVLQFVREIEALDLPTGEDFRALVKAVREKYRI